MRVAFLTVGDTSRKTGGYLYNAEVIRGLRERGMEVEEYTGSGDLFDPSGFDVIVVDMLARTVYAPHVVEWRRTATVVALVHELPSVADGTDPESAEDTLLAASNRVVTVSEAGRRILVARGVPEEKIEVIPPGLDGISVREVEGRDGTTETVVLCVAQWIRRKGILELVRAWKEVRKPESRLLLVGETDADPDYERSVRGEIDGDPFIEIAGSVDDDALARAYAGADLFVLPSRFEGYGIVYAEALAAGLPVIAADIAPVSDVVGDEAAVLVPPDSHAHLCRALERLLGDAELRRRMSEAAIVRARGLPRWKDAISAFVDVLGAAARCCREDQNRRSWNAVVGAHESHRAGLAGYLAGGGTTLFPEDVSLLSDVSGMDVVHLQCNTGADTLSIAALRANVTGVDISEAAISAARELSIEAGITANFERADVYDWLLRAASDGRKFDVVYASYGVLCWLYDLEAWARGIFEILREGGRLVLVEFHPLATVFSEEWKLEVPYRTGGEVVVDETGVGDYVAASRGGLAPAGFSEGVRDFRNPEPCSLYNWGLGEVLTAVAGAGLRIERLEEYPYANGERNFLRMREGEGRRMYPPEGVPGVPLMYGLRAGRDTSTPREDVR